MKLLSQRSRDIIDRRKPWLVGAALALVSAVGAWLGFDRRDPDAHLVAVMSTALDRGNAYWAARVPGYQRAQLVIFDGRLDTRCGEAFTVEGPFYCTSDARIYLDLAWLRAIENDLARAMVLAHELGHHVQWTRGERSQGPAHELRADCYAGVWIGHEQRAGNLHAGDIPAALGTAWRHGDDKRCPDCTPTTWTHGSAADRVAAVTDGLDGRCERY